MAVERVADTPASGADGLRTSIDEQILSFFVTSSHVAPIGNMVAGLVALSLLWDRAPRPLLWAWLGIVVALAALQAVAALDPKGTTAKLDTPGVSFNTSVLAGLVWGALPWLDINAFSTDEAYRWICLGLAFAIGAGAMGGLSALMGVAVRVHVPMYTLVAAAFLVAGSPVVAGGVLVYLALMVNDGVGTSRNLRRLMAVRVEAADLAADAEFQARHDPLTGLLNRAGAFERIESCRDGPSFVVMFIDLDHFKDVNDRLGHEAGDLVLVETAHRIRDAMRPEDIVARLGGDEFLVVFERGDGDLEVIVERLLVEVERPVGFGADEVKISASIGITAVDTPEWTTSTFLRQADHALYQAKREGRRRMVWFDDQLADQLEERSSLERELREAIRAGAIEPVAQPVIDLSTDEVSWVEITPRWMLPAGSQVPPTVFLPLAEEIGLIDALTRSMLDRAAQARVGWRGHPVLGSASVMVRVAASHLMRGGLVDDVGAIFVGHGLGPGELQLMFTETAEIRDPVFAADAINSMRVMGVGIVLGEFGRGKSTLRDLLHLPIDVVSLHPRLVQEATQNERLRKLLAAVAHVAGSLGLSVAADGADTLAQLDVVRGLSVPYAQGEALCPPQSLEDLEAQIAYPRPV
ncbi:MAG: EAL domain-containing protein [Actinomycetia bacterium]|nr:EAL domain-containing protein [Actinomycetes bacterium]